MNTILGGGSPTGTEGEAAGGNTSAAEVKNQIAAETAHSTATTSEGDCTAFNDLVLAPRTASSGLPALGDSRSFEMVRNFDIDSALYDRAQPLAV